MEYVVGVFNAFISIIKTFSIADVLDVTVVAFIIYSVIKLIRETRAEQLVKGILILLIAYFFSFQFNMIMLSTCLEKFFQFGVLALLVVFQPELRNALEQIGRSEFGSKWFIGANIKEEDVLIQTQKKTIEIVSYVAQRFQESMTGALIVFERKTKLGEVIETGTTLDASSSVQLIGNIFYNKAPLHDGAMVIREGKVYAAGCILPLTKNENVSADLGTRHRAAMGISQDSDAVVVIVSEETGAISIAINGVLKRNYNKKTLQDELERLILPQKSKEEIKTVSRTYFRKAKKDE